MWDRVGRNLGRDAYLAAQAAGRTMDLPAAVELANSLFAEVVSELTRNRIPVFCTLVSVGHSHTMPKGEFS
jgi:hypothetical protein